MSTLMFSKETKLNAEGRLFFKFQGTHGERVFGRDCARKLFSEMCACISAEYQQGLHTDKTPEQVLFRMVETLAAPFWSFGREATFT